MLEDLEAGRKQQYGHSRNSSWARQWNEALRAPDGKRPASAHHIHHVRPYQHAESLRLSLSSIDMFDLTNTVEVTVHEHKSQAQYEEGVEEDGGEEGGEKKDQAQYEEGGREEDEEEEEGCEEEGHDENWHHRSACACLVMVIMLDLTNTEVTVHEHKSQAQYEERGEQDDDDDEEHEHKSKAQYEEEITFRDIVIGRQYEEFHEDYDDEEDEKAEHKSQAQYEEFHEAYVTPADSHGNTRLKVIVAINAACRLRLP
ncbi:unnamed protein product [Zymoseptoria tritici ST99CH_1A5]|uniref:Uncharacterized protein n=1 Tax=Zymoseptoria tritici ST99CH_1A5 TaxID=1276529 RepID=A0A1Y6M0B9_ZYMTR|nr:unnamed protein product [Zymoseptoria tritici ST99CH_1A5]